MDFTMNPPPTGNDSLPFDVTERLGAVERELVNLAGDRRELRLLDVGGAPGRVARALEQRHPGWTCSIADLPECHADRYVRGSGLALPFPERSVDIAFCCDVLEHIPAVDRERFLGELARVARLGVVVAAPFAHPAVDQAERLIDAIHREFFGSPHPWLDEHRRNGLPDLEEAVRILESVGERQASTEANRSGVSVRLGRNADLERWFVLQLAELLSQLLPGARDPWTAFQAALGVLWTESEAAAGSVPYRWVLTVSLQIEGEMSPANIPSHGGSVSGMPATLAVQSDRIVRRLEALADFGRDLARGWSRMAGGSEAETTSVPNAKDELIVRLAAILREQEARFAAEPPPDAQGIKGTVGHVLRRILKDPGRSE
jgi:ubiquinone/menaquinone biosynthesis C-methylase UbiE